MNHRIFERTLRPLVFRRARLFECHVNLNSTALRLLELDLGVCWPPWGLALLECMSEHLARVAGVIVFHHWQRLPNGLAFEPSSQRRQL